MARKEDRKAAGEYPETVALAKQAIEDKLGQDVRIYDVRGKSSVTDFFMVASAGSGPQLRAIAEELTVNLKKSGIGAHRKSGDPESGWIVVDYIEVVIHLFLKETREYYAIEELWEEAGR